MPQSARLLRGALAALLLTPAVAWAADWPSGPLISAEALRGRLGSAELVLLDASPSPKQAKQRIPGAHNADPFRFGDLRTQAPQRIEQRLRDWGIGQGKKIVVYDEGGSNTATKIYFDLYRHGVAASDLYLLDGGLARWRAVGGALADTPPPKPEPGDFRLALRAQEQSELPEVLQASGEPQRQALVDALSPEHYYGGQQFFNRGGHLPGARLLPGEDFFKADKTFKSPAELRALVAAQGLHPGLSVHSYCGGGVAATVPYFALKFLLGYPQVKVFSGSQLDWVKDPRELPLWTWAEPQLLREAEWLKAWSLPMLRMFGATRLNVIDVRSPEQYAQGHVPFSINLPLARWQALAGEPQRLAEWLGQSGVQPDEEALILSSKALDEDAALVFAWLEKLGHPRVSLLLEGLDDWALAGRPWTREPTLVGPKRAPNDLAIEPVAYPLRAARQRGLPAGAQAQRLAVGGRAEPGALQLPLLELLQADGRPRPAAEVWKRLRQAGVERHATLRPQGERPGQSAQAYVLLRLMGLEGLNPLDPQ